MIVSLLFFTLFARLKVFEAQALIRSPKPNPSSLLRQASLWKGGAVIRMKTIWISDFFFLPDWVDASAALPAKALTKPSAWPSKAPHWHSHLHVFLFVHTLQIIQICLKAICFRVFYKPTRSRSKSFSTSWCLDRATLWWWKLYKDKDDVEDDDESALEWVRPKQPRQRRLWHQVLWEQNTLCTRWLSIAASMTWVSNLHTHP